MRICYFGNFNPEYARNKVIIKGLRENGVEVLICHTAFNRFKGLWDLSKKHRDLKDKYDILIVGYSDSRFMVPWARIMSNKKIVWDAFYSLYDSWVFDRKLVSSRSLKAGYYWFLDWFSAILSDLILLDTDKHIDYFSKTFIIKKHKFARVFVGSDPAVFYPREISGSKDFKKILVHFHGNYIPLQGVEYIIKAAKLLKNEQNIGFNLVGSGQTYFEMRGLAKQEEVQNVTFIDRVDINRLADLISESDICLGIFGNTGKAQRVIPNKVYEAIAMARPVVTSDTPAIQEIFTNRENILLCQNADAEDLARAIKELCSDTELRSRIARQGHALFETVGVPVVIGRHLINEIGLKINHGF